MSYEGMNGSNFQGETQQSLSHIFYFTVSFDNYCSFEKPKLMVKKKEKSEKSLPCRMTSPRPSSEICIGIP